MPSLPRMYELVEFARRLESRAAAERLLHRLRPGLISASRPSGRYQFVMDAIVERPVLLRQLLEGEEEALESRWQEMLGEHEADIPFLHGIAVMYREWALEGPGGAPERDCWLLSTPLWALLLCARDFWRYLRDGKPPADGGGIPGNAAVDWRTEDSLLQETIGTVLSHHLGTGSRAFAAGRMELAEVHIRCLAVCQKGVPAIGSTLEERGVKVRLPADASRAARIQTLAGRLLEDWGASITAEAERLLSDPSRISSLPAGIRKSYDAAVSHLESFLMLGVPIVRVLKQCLEWFNDWSFDLYMLKDHDGLRRLVDRARSIADALASTCTRGQGHLPENRAISQHYLLRGFTVEDPEVSVREYRESLAWNGENENSRKLLEEAEHARVCANSRKAMELGSYPEAENLLRMALARAVDGNRRKELVRLLAVNHNSQAVKLVNRAREVETAFEAAADAILECARGMQEAAARGLPPLSVIPQQDWGCAVCDTRARTGREVSETIASLARQICARVQSQGRYTFPGLARFWQEFGDALCSSCRELLEEARQGKRSALYQLEEAVAQDPEYETARNNLEELKKST